MKKSFSLFFKNPHLVLCYYRKLTVSEAVRITWHAEQHKLAAEFGKSQRNVTLFTRNMHAMPDTSLNLPQLFFLYITLMVNPQVKKICSNDCSCFTHLHLADHTKKNFLNFMLLKSTSDCKISHKIKASFRGESTNMQMWNLEKLNNLIHTTFLDDDLFLDADQDPPWQH